jgi:hypothetical protein
MFRHKIEVVIVDHHDHYTNVNLNEIQQSEGYLLG